MNFEFHRNDGAWIAGAAALAAASALLASRAIRPAPGLGALAMRKASRAGSRTANILTNQASAAADMARHAPGRTGAGALAALSAGALLYVGLRNRGMNGSANMVEESIVVGVPVSTAYNQWTQFEHFPRFMESVEEVRQIDDSHLHWRATVAGKTKEWDSEITEQIPDKRIAWRSTSGVQNAGVVTFHRIDDSHARVMLQMEFHPESAGERMAGAMGGVKFTARNNLRKFKDLVESRGAETGAWRGSIPQH